MQSTRLTHPTFCHDRCSHQVFSFHCHKLLNFKLNFKRDSLEAGHVGHNSVIIFCVIAQFCSGPFHAFITSIEKSEQLSFGHYSTVAELFGSRCREGGQKDWLHFSTWEQHHRITQVLAGANQRVLVLPLQALLDHPKSRM